MFHILLMLTLICGTGLPGTYGFISCTIPQALEKSFVCQNAMIKNLASNHTLTCTDAYRTLEGCLTSYIKNCMGLFAYLTGDIVKVLKSSLFSCIYYEVDPATINSLVREQLKCDNHFYFNASRCWNGFRSTLLANRTDSSLCRMYSVAKSCAINTIDDHCPPIKGQATKDTNNPFCGNNEDPPDKATTSIVPTPVMTRSTNLVSAVASTIYPPSRCSQEYYFDIAKSCEVEFINGLDLTSPHSACRTTTREKQLFNCFTSYYTTCFDDLSLSEKLAETMLGVTKTLYFFCSIWPSAPNTSSLQPQIARVVNCKQSFFTEVRSCADNANSSKETDNCRRYNEFKHCYKEAFESFCYFNEHVQVSYLKDEFNPFCKNEKRGHTESSALMTTHLKSSYVPLVLTILLYLLFG